ncbi:MAG: exosome complex protein Rrp42 [Thermoplasmata archaeon]|nr:exosome complex protein Rrp42 [Thermoplasmata archaeon]
MSKFTESVVSEIKKDYIQKLLSQGSRLDGRAYDEFRKIEIVKNFVPRACGSALVKIGNTQVLVGVKIEPGEPFPDTPDTGVLSTNAELVPLASPTFEAGPPGEEAIELARVVDRGIRESKAVDLEKLVIKPGELVWVVFVDIHVLDYDGNLFDASALGSIIALKNSIIPASKFNQGDDFPLPMNHYPATVTFAKIGDNMVVDPNLDEENIAHARITISSDESGRIHAIQKGLEGTFKIEEIKNAISMAISIGNKLRDEYILKGD